MINKKERLHRSRFHDSEGPPDLVLPGDVESALLSNIVYRESFSEIRLKSQAIKLKFPLSRTPQSLPQPRKENRIILVESFVIRGLMSVGISSVMGC